MNAKNLIIIVATLIGFGAIVIITTNSRNASNNSIRKSALIINASVYKTERDGYRDNSWRLYIKYNYKEQVYEDSFIKPALTKSCSMLGKEFPVIIDTLNPANSYLLITPQDFQEFDLSFPDSLNWVKDCLRN